MNDRLFEEVLGSLSLRDLDRDSLWQLRKLLVSRLDVQARPGDGDRALVTSQAILVSLTELSKRFSLDVPDLEWEIFKNSMKKIVAQMERVISEAPIKISNVPSSADYSHIATVSYIYANTLLRFFRYFERGQHIVLDIGGGDGFFAVAIMTHLRKLSSAANVAEVVSIDADPRRSRFLERYLQEVELLPGISTEVAALEGGAVVELIMRRSIKILSLNHVLEHMPTVSQARKVICDLLDTGPLVVSISVPYDDPPHSSISPGHRISFTCASFCSLVNNLPHVRSGRVKLDSSCAENGLVFLHAAAEAPNSP